MRKYNMEEITNENYWSQHPFLQEEERRGYTQEKLAEQADINEKLIGFYETDKRIPPVINLVAIAEALEVTVNELCGANILEPGTELEREINKEIRNVLNAYCTLGRA